MYTARTFSIIAAAFGMLGIAFGAFGSHALKSAISAEMLSVFETSIRYQMYHCFALFVVAWSLQLKRSRKFQYAGWSFVAGIVLFSGSLYILALTGIRVFGIITPFGGLSLLMGWLMLALGYWEKESGS
jgi:uncharacterized membrane protein YgdD (TMEM256/DUF423 family)